MTAPNANSHEDWDRKPLTKMDVYLELGAKRVFAVAVDWPGWARAGSDDAAAQSALVDYGKRYRTAIGAAGSGLILPESADELEIVERLEGGASTDFGVPGATPRADDRATEGDDLDRLTSLLRAAWVAFEHAADTAEGAELRPSGPRGGGRSLDKIRAHVAEAEDAYVRALGGKGDPEQRWQANKEAFLTAARARARGELPDVGPRGGKRWPARYAIRRSAWHALDHAWEIEDRSAG